MPPASTTHCYLAAGGREGWSSILLRVRPYLMADVRRLVAAIAVGRSNDYGRDNCGDRQYPKNEPHDRTLLTSYTRIAGRKFWNPAKGRQKSLAPRHITWRSKAGPYFLVALPSMAVDHCFPSGDSSNFIL